MIADLSSDSDIEVTDGIRSICTMRQIKGVVPPG